MRIHWVIIGIILAMIGLLYLNFAYENRPKPETGYSSDDEDAYSCACNIYDGNCKCEDNKPETDNSRSPSEGEALPENDDSEDKNGLVPLQSLKAPER